MRLKKDTISLGFLKREYERVDDEFTLSLWEDNVRLEKELSLLKKEYNKVSIFFLITLIFLIISGKLRKIGKREKKTNTTGETKPVEKKEGTFKIHKHENTQYSTSE